MPGRSFAWLIFSSDETCDKAFDSVSKAQLQGKSLTVDFCGSKSKNSGKHGDAKSNSQPINPLELYVHGCPPDVTKEQLKLVFRTATDIKFPAVKNRLKSFCFVSFATEADAKAAFEKGKSLKIAGHPVDVLYARMRKVEPSKAETTTKRDALKSQQPAAKKAKLTVQEDESDDEDEEDLDSSDEGISEKLGKSSKLPIKTAGKKGAIDGKKNASPSMSKPVGKKGQPSPKVTMPESDDDDDEDEDDLMDDDEEESDE